MRIVVGVYAYGIYICKGDFETMYTKRAIIDEKNEYVAIHYKTEK